MQPALHNADNNRYYGSVGRRAVERIEEIEAIARATESQCRTWQWLKNFTALGVGGPVAAIVYPSTMTGAAMLVHQLEQAGLRWRALGHGTSILASDELHDYVAISLRLLDERLIFEDGRVRVHAGYSLPALVHATAEHGLAGLEKFAGTGGSLGGALRMQLSKQISNIWEMVEEVRLAEQGTIKVLSPHGSELTDEQFAMLEHNLILASTLKLMHGDAEEIQRQLWRIYQLRREAQPFGEGVASRIFRTSEPTGAVIEELGLKGQTCGGARVSETHADFIVNEGKATAEDVFALTDLIRDRVRRERGLELDYDVDVWREETEEE